MQEQIQEIQNQLTEKFESEISFFQDGYDVFVIEATKDNVLKILTYLKDELQFNFLTDLCGVHYPKNEGKEFAVVYHLKNLVKKITIRVKVFVSAENPEVYTASALFLAANWMERETFDFFGINFIGHPNMKRILNPDEMTYHPMRKEFPLEDQTRLDKDDEMFGR